MLKQAHAAGLTASTKLVMTTAGVHEQLKKAFAPEGMILPRLCSSATDRPGGSFTCSN